MRDIGTCHAHPVQQRHDRGRNDLRKAFVANPAFLPGIVKLLSRTSEMIDEIDGRRMAAEDCRYHVRSAKRQCDRGITIGQLLHRSCACFALLARDQQRRHRSSRCDAIKRRNQGRKSGPLRRRNVQCRNALREAKRLRHDASIQTVGVRHRSRGKIDRVDMSAALARIDCGKAIAASLHRHRDAVLVPVGHRPLAFGVGKQPRREPSVGLSHRFSLQPAARNIGTIGGNAGHPEPPK